MNNACLIGRLTKDPELRQTGSGTSVCSFTLAIDRPYKNSQGERETDFIPCVAWRQTAEFVAKYFEKGMRMGATGTIQPRHWDDEKGERHYITEVICDQIYFADAPRQARTSYSAPQDQQAYTKVTVAPAPAPDWMRDDLSGQQTSLPFDL